MSKYIINGGRKLRGTVCVQGAKNAVLPLFAAALLTDERVVIHNCPDLTDVSNMARILNSLGAETERRGDSVTIDTGYMRSHEIPSRLAGELRSSIFTLGALLGRAKKAKVAYPGGCDIGLRPIDIHLKALKEMNVRIADRYGYILCDATDMRPAAVTLDYPSVGATENVMLLAATADGVTTIANAAREPEVVDLQNFLNRMGARISGAGTSFVRVEGVRSLKGTEYSTMPDRIVAGTYMIAAAVCGGEVLLRGVCPEHIASLTSKLAESGAEIEIDGSDVLVRSDGKLRAPGCIETRPYPGFPTDLQAPFGVLASVAEGTTVVVENIFETRFKHVAELTKMGASVKVKDKVAVFTGVKTLSGAETTAMDLRGGAALVVAGLKAQGTTVVNDIHHIERGYEAPEKVLSSLGADIVKV